MAELEQNKMAKFLLIRADNAEIKPIALDSVFCVDEFLPENISSENEKIFLLHQNKKMPLIFLENQNRSSFHPEQFLVVINLNAKIIGLIVEEIIGIFSGSFVQSKNQECQISATINIAEKNYPLINIEDLAAKEFPLLFAQNTYKKNANHKSLLFVDESVFFRKFIPPMLTENGYNVTIAMDGKEALEILKNTKNFSAIITALDMPVINGWRLISECRTDNDLNSLPIIALKSRNNPEFLPHDFADKINFYIEKTNKTELLQALDKICS